MTLDDLKELIGDCRTCAALADEIMAGRMKPCHEWERVTVGTAWRDEPEPIPEPLEAR